MKKIITTLLVITFIAINIDITKSETLIKDTEKELIDNIMLIKKNKKKAVFSLIDKNTMKIEGYILGGSYDDYLKVINNDIKTIVVNSGGGDTDNGLRIGMDINTRGLTVIVDGIAMSSAANYIFLAGRKKIIKRGIVGFHGNAQAASRKTDLDKYKKELKKDLQDRYKITEKNFNEIIDGFTKHLEMEKEFYKNIGVSQDLFDLTQNPEKGLESRLGFQFDFLIPSNTTMEKFGIKNVEGESDLNFAKQLGINIIYY